MTGGEPAAGQPLTGTSVLDLSGRIGAYCSKVLADLGAAVLTVERPAGDALRFLPPRRDGETGPESGLLYAYYHHNKRGITLDFGRAAAQPLLRELAADTDVILASPKGGDRAVTGYGDDPPSLCWAPPDSLTCFITPFGLTGPLREWRATPFTSFAMSGAMHPVGPLDGPPVAMPGQQLYDEAGVCAAFLVQAALRGPPAVHAQVIDHAVHDVACFTRLGQQPFSRFGAIKTRATNFGPPPGGIWRCRDGLVDIAAHAPHHWDIFVDLVGRPAVLDDPFYGDRQIRIQLFDLLTGIIADALATWPAGEFVEAAQAAGLPCALTQTGAQFVEGAQPRSRGFFVRSSRAGTGTVDIPGAPFRSSPAMIGYGRPAPRLGESNTEVFVDTLGHSVAELEKWRADGLV